MAKNMIVFALFLYMLGCTSDQKDSIDFQGIEAMITRYDLTLTPCSGGWIINLVDGSATYQWEDTEKLLDLDPQTQNGLPQKVSMQFTIDKKRCSIFDGFIDVTQIEKQ
jgi:hypothetical protein